MPIPLGIDIASSLPSIHAVLLVGIALVFGFTNGKNSSAGIVAPLIATRALGYRSALIMAAVAEGIGPFLFGIAVARTIGADLIAPGAITLPVVYAALLAATGWNSVSLALGIPSSTSHALAGGMIGATWIGYGSDAILSGGVIKIVLALLLSPILSMIAGNVMLHTVIFLAQGATPRVNRTFRRGQIFSAVALALTYGSNDGQKIMGMIALGLVAAGEMPSFSIPLWVVAISAASICLGTLAGGRRTIRTVGRKFFRLRPVHGFSAQAASATVILGAALLGGPVSTSHVVSSTIVGAGTADRMQMVRWAVVERILSSWLITFPASAVVGMVLDLILRAILS
ncbi:MAG TPA: inorganic phosphate transporter [Aggregatilinea sp.]|jgi:PiT family inorganic phosphate transporter|uniref:inorganic phosphate transporter n=1 Tax=Aggregatilinea sp. TaxID=2806333 RepID=UPI002C5D810B|nr:inorganic phosphate transporter [Aggregatilinea sp.]HML24837.1 inorganic phosphate transporter [Aggregatilinea sp.]